MNANNPILSIIVPVYNVENYIEECILSLLNQNIDNMEIIVVDDGSSDRSVDIVNSFRDSRIIILKKKNGGLSSARNFGLKRARGEYVAFVDGGREENQYLLAQKFDFIFFTIGALPWFRDLDPVFALVKRCLKPEGTLLVHDSHPFLCLLPVPDEEEYREGEIRVTYPYFRDTPWLENSGMSYLSETYDSPTFTSFTHTVSDIVGGVLRAGLRLEAFQEYDHDVGISPVYDGKNLPLSYLLLAKNL